MRFKPKNLYKMIYNRNYHLTYFSPYIHILIIMKKISLIIITIFCTVILYGCWTKWHKITYIFEDFYGSFFTENNYNTSTIQTSWIWSQLLQNDIIAIYDQKDWSGFVGSIIISKRITDNSVQDFVNENIKLVKKEWFRTEVSKNTSFTCNSESIKTTTVNSKLKTNLNTVYFSQSFFKRWKYIYIISFASSDMSERNSFSENIKHTRCE